MAKLSNSRAPMAGIILGIVPELFQKFIPFGRSLFRVLVVTMSLVPQQRIGLNILNESHLILLILRRHVE